MKALRCLLVAVTGANLGTPQLPPPMAVAAVVATGSTSVPAARRRPFLARRHDRISNSTAVAGANTSVAVSSKSTAVVGASTSVAVSSRSAAAAGANTSRSVSPAVDSVAASHVVAATEAAVTAPGGGVRAPRVYFLFLAVDKVSNLDVWKAFFKQGLKNQYRALVHCKLPSCISSVAGSPLTPVPTVPSEYCSDLVSPMNQLLAEALKFDKLEEPSPFDKFAFVSDSTLPAKPFHYVYKSLTSHGGSDFCIFPASEWADVVSVSAYHGSDLEVAVKSHQWVTLQRSHAEQAVRQWSLRSERDLMSNFRMNRKPGALHNHFGDSRNFGCLDEFWFMAVLYGRLQQVTTLTDHSIPLSLFTGTPLQVSAATGWQGKCDTFVLWPEHIHSPFDQIYSSLDGPSKPHVDNPFRPGWWDRISTASIATIRSSSFLFARKFVDKPRLAEGGDFAEAYMRIVIDA